MLRDFRLSLVPPTGPSPSGTTFFKLPCGEVDPGETDEEAMLRIVNNTLGRDDGIQTGELGEGGGTDW